MIQQRLSRRAVMAGATALAWSASPVLAAPRPSISVLKDPNCGCCEVWVRILREKGFDVAVTPMHPDLIVRRKSALGVPRRLTSCHTGVVEGYVIEGHVPVADIRRLLEERPDAIGLAVPGMPYGSPGMGPEDEREAYDVMLIERDGGASVFSSYAAGEKA